VTLSAAKWKSCREQQTQDLPNQLNVHCLPPFKTSEQTPNKISKNERGLAWVLVIIPSDLVRRTTTE
jgi:hypothetical protein